MNKGFHDIQFTKIYISGIVKYRKGNNVVQDLRHNSPSISNNKIIHLKGTGELEKNRFYLCVNVTVEATQLKRPESDFED